jgi:hypothetical protein
VSDADDPFEKYFADLANRAAQAGLVLEPGHDYTGTRLDPAAVVYMRESPTAPGHWDIKVVHGRGKATSADEGKQPIHARGVAYVLWHAFGVPAHECQWTRRPTSPPAAVPPGGNISTGRPVSPLRRPT